MSTVFLKPKFNRSFGRENKYRAKRTVLDGVTFDSKGESQRFAFLSLMEKRGVISNLRLQVPYKMMHQDHLLTTYKADFVYDVGECEVVEDFKSSATRTQVYMLKKKMMRIMHGIAIKEVTNPREPIDEPPL